MCSYILHATCLNGWTLFKGSCYLFQKTEASWYAAKLTCENHGSHLIKIDSLYENNFILQLIKSSSTPLLVGVWLGMKDFSSEPYKWTDGTLAIFSPWNGQEPNDINKADSCAAMYTNGDFQGKWLDDTCSGHSYPSVCETVPK